MLWGRRALFIVLLVALLGADGGYWLANREPDPVLLTIALPWAQPDLFHLEEGEGRLYFATNNNGGERHVSIIDTRSGNPVELHGALGSAPGLPLVDYQSGHYFDADQANTDFLMIDTRTDAVLSSIPIPSGWWSYALDTARDRVMVAL